jgi:acid phosphatase (class A)
MLRMKGERTDATREAIEKEKDVSTTLFGDRTISEHLEGVDHPEVSRLLNYAWGDLSMLIMREKRRFDRVRPDKLLSSVAPAIDVPSHPAYPSGHATQSFFLAYVLGAINNERAVEYLARAAEIARHREVAGLHYPSDSAAGKELARQYFEALQKDPLFTELLTKAKLAR